MGFLRRLFGASTPAAKRAEPPSVSIVVESYVRPDSTVELGDHRGDLPPEAFTLRAGNGLEVVGESHHQAVIEKLIGGRRPERVRATFWATLVPEPDNPYDTNAVSVRVDGTHVGYITRPGAKAFAPILDRLAQAGRVAYCRADVVGGGKTESGDQASYGVFVYAADVSEQKELIARELDGKSRAEIATARPALGDGRDFGPGTYRGRHHSAWHPEVSRLRAMGADEEAEQLLLGIVRATEEEASREGYGVAPSAYQALAVIYRKRKDRAAEVAILERFVAQEHARGVVPGQLIERLRKLRTSGG